MFDAICAALIYLSATNRLFYTLPTPAEQAQQILTLSTATMLATMSKLQALSVTRSVIARDPELSAKYDAYHRGEGKDGDDWVWQEEGVINAVAKVMNDRALQAGNRTDVKEHEMIDSSEYVDKLTAGLEDPIIS